MEGEPKPAWWRKNRWAAAVAVCLIVAGYPCSRWPAAYAQGRGWASDATVRAIYRPLDRRVRGAAPPLRMAEPGWVGFDYILPDTEVSRTEAAAEWYLGQVARWYQLGAAHRSESLRPPPPSLH